MDENDNVVRKASQTCEIDEKSHRDKSTHVNDTGDVNDPEILQAIQASLRDVENIVSESGYEKVAVVTDQDIENSSCTTSPTQTLTLGGLDMTVDSIVSDLNEDHPLQTIMKRTMVNQEFVIKINCFQKIHIIKTFK